MKKGQIVWVNFDGIGSEQSGVRPAIIVQNDRGNKYSNTTIVVPLTRASTNKKLIPTHLFVKKESLGDTYEDSIVLTEQIRIIDKKRIQHRVGEISTCLLREIENKILIALGVVA